jgi:hypothetical protein
MQNILMLASAGDVMQAVGGGGDVLVSVGAVVAEALASGLCLSAALLLYFASERARMCGLAPSAVPLSAVLEPSLISRWLAAYEAALLGGGLSLYRSCLCVGAIDNVMRLQSVDGALKEGPLAGDIQQVLCQSASMQWAQQQGADGMGIGVQAGEDVREFKTWVDRCKSRRLPVTRGDARAEQVRRLNVLSAKMRWHMLRLGAIAALTATDSHALATQGDTATCIKHATSTYFRGSDRPAMRVKEEQVC